MADAIPRLLDDALDADVIRDYAARFAGPRLANKRSTGSACDVSCRAFRHTDAMNPETPIESRDLIARLDALEQEAHRYLNDSAGSDDAVELDQTRQGRLSRMDALQAQAMNQAARNRASQQLRRIAATRARLGSPDFGLCLDCDEPIAPARLRHDPTVLRCLGCASARE